MKRIIILALAAIITLGANAQKASKKEQTVTIQTNGVCQKCADKFKENVPYFKGVKDYSYDMKTAKLTITYDASRTNPDQLRQQISKLGYNADNVKADAAARAKLPACCRAEKSSGCGGCGGHSNGQGCGNHSSGQGCGNHGNGQGCGNHGTSKGCGNH
jgi:copper chaperone CopZ